MTNIEALIKNLKKYERENYIFQRRRILKEDGMSKTLGWIVYKDNIENKLENKSFDVLNNMKEKLKGQ